MTQARRKFPDAPESVSDATLRAFAGYNMKRATHVVQADMAATLAPLGLRITTFSALVLIADNPGLRQTQLAAALSIERSNLVLIVDDLDSAALILRNPVPSDRRAYALTATLQGLALCKKALAAVAAHEARLMGGLDAGERAALNAALMTIRKTGQEPA